MLVGIFYLCGLIFHTNNHKNDMVKLRVTLISTSFPVQSNPSSGIFVYRLAQELSHHVALTVVTPHAKNALPLAPNTLTKIISFKYFPERFSVLAHQPGGIPVALKKNKWMYFALPLFFISLAMTLLFKCRQTDVFHANWAINGVVSGLVAKLLRIKSVTTLHGDDVNRARTSLVDEFILWACLRVSDCVISVNDEFRDWIVNRFPKFAHKAVTVPNGVNDEFIAVSNTRSYEQCRNIVTVASLIPRKGIDTIIKALAVPDIAQYFVLTIVGDGHLFEELNQLAVSSGIAHRVVFKKTVDPRDVPKLLADNDVFVLASHSEGRPSVILEAMATAMPIIATDIVGTKELIQSGQNGLLIPDNDDKQLAADLQKLANDKLLRETLGKNAGQFIRQNKLTWSHTTQRHVELYQALG